MSKLLCNITSVGITQTHYITPDQDKKVTATRWTQPVVARPQSKVIGVWTVPSRAGRKDDKDKHGIFDFFFVTIGSSSDLFGNIETSIEVRTSRATATPRLRLSRVPCPLPAAARRAEARCRPCRVVTPTMKVNRYSQ